MVKRGLELCRSGIPEKEERAIVWSSGGGLLIELD